jgi:hypothetical protein
MTRNLRDRVRREVERALMRVVVVCLSSCQCFVNVSAVSTPPASYHSSTFILFYGYTTSYLSTALIPLHTAPHLTTTAVTAPNPAALPQLLRIAQLPGEGVKPPQLLLGEVGLGGSRSSPGL